MSDGVVWYRIDGPDDRAPLALPADAQQEREFRIKASSANIGTARLLSDGGVFFLDIPGEPRLRLEEYRPGLFFSSTGEALDLMRTPPTYGNIPLS